MSTLPILQYPDPALREKCVPINKFDRELSALLADMAETMYAAPGVGLAAPQVGAGKRITVIDVSESRGELRELINPEILATSGKTESEEGCLSIIGSDGDTFRDFIPRFEKVKVRALDRNGKEFQFEAEGLLAFCVQHELDHLNGVLFIDHLSRIKRARFKKWFAKQRGE